jgi:hypothetical protein
MRFLGIWPLSALLVAMGGAILFCFDPNGGGFYPVCLFHQATGLLCPGCGSLRAMHQLLHGHVLAAFEFNPLLLLCLPAAAWYAARYALTARRVAKVSGARPSWDAATTKPQRLRCSSAQNYPCIADPEERRPPLLRLPMPERPPLPIRPLWLWLFLGTALAFSVWRNLPGFPIAMPPS